MKVREIDLIVEILRRTSPSNCLEWGSGHSTLFYPAWLPSTSRWHAVEHDRAWSDHIIALNRRPNVSVHHVAPDHEPWSDPHGDGSADDLATYLDLPRQWAPFDLIIVDGRARVACLQRAFSLLTRDGIVLLHDANRHQYEIGFASYAHQELFRDHRTITGGLWVGSRERPIGSAFNVDRQRAIWAAYQRIGPTFVGRALRC